MNKKAFILAFITVLIWGSTFTAIRASLLGGFTPGHLVLTRFLVASIMFILYFLLPGVSFRLPKKQDILRILILGWIGISIYHMGVTFGEQTVTAGTAGMIIGSGPVFTALIAVIVLKEQLGKLGWIGLGVGFCGIVLIAIGTAGPTLSTSIGAIYLLISAVATSIFFVFQKSLYSRYKPIELTAYFTWAGTLPLLIFTPGLWQDIQHATLEANLSAVYAGIFPAAIAYAMWGTALSLGKTSSVTSILYVEPVIAVFVAWIWLQELPSILSVIGGLIAISSVIVINLLGIRQRAFNKR
ncbi:DMT family transporter [Lentibacillus sp. N15]|uniref:DMT family transporter n=1 Tax=Lentibacillus songyuanensis TaxID=3136161 RepID=UPI0031BB31DC